MPKSVARALFIPCALTGLLIGSAGCMTGPKVVTKHDVEILRILFNSTKFRRRYDPMKWEPTEITIRRNHVQD